MVAGLRNFSGLTPARRQKNDTLPAYLANGRGHTVAKAPTRVELERLDRDVQKLMQRLEAVDRELAIQFDRIAALQADIDLIRAA